VARTLRVETLQATQFPRNSRAKMRPAQSAAFISITPPCESFSAKTSSEVKFCRNRQTLLDHL
jgi:hypothetical protein